MIPMTVQDFGYASPVRFGEHVILNLVQTSSAKSFKFFVHASFKFDSSGAVFLWIIVENMNLFIIFPYIYKLTGNSNII